MNLVKITTYLSILIQIIALFVGMIAYEKKIPIKDIMLSDILLIENVVQAVEFTFYLVIGFVITNIPTDKLAQYRYYDWVITTPIMLLTTLLFFIYENNKKEDKIESTWEIIKKEKKTIFILFLLNFGMLTMGYLQETKQLPLLITNTLGFTFLIYNFYLLKQYAKTEISKKLYWIMLFVWSMYGVAATFNPILKNTSYNMLDVVSKNFYGVFLAILIFKLK